MVVTLSLAGFVASMAYTLDKSLADSAYYEVGADLNLAEGGEYTGDAPAGQLGAPLGSASTQANAPARSSPADL